MTPFLRLAVLLIALCAMAPAWAQNDTRQREARSNDAADSVRRAEVETGGDVLRAEPMQRGGREVYRLKVLTPEGRVRVMQDDPRSRSDRRSREQDRDARAAAREREERALAREREAALATDRRRRDDERPTP